MFKPARSFPTRKATLLCTLLAPVLTGCSEDWPTSTYLVKLNVGDSEVIDVVNEIVTELDVEPLHIFESLTEGFQVNMPEGILENLEGINEVEYVIIDNPENKVPPEDVGEEPQLGEGETPEGIERIGGAVMNVDFTGIQVAVVDTGVDLDHPDLNVVGGKDIVAEGGGSGGGGDDLQGHGTHVAGTIGAIADGNGVAGVAPGVGIHAVRVLDENGSGTFGDVIAGLEYVLEQPEIKVVNLSLGGSGDPNADAMLKDAIQNLIDAGVVVCIAAGNDAANTNSFIPAGYDLGIVVSAYDADGGDNGPAYFSNFGDAVDITAPGVNIDSTYPDGSFMALSGTSMATPHVAGAAAAYMAKYPSEGPQAVRSAMINTGEDDFYGQGGDFPEPLLDVEALLR